MHLRNQHVVPASLRGIVLYQKPSTSASSAPSYDRAWLGQWSLECFRRIAYYEAGIVSQKGDVARMAKLFVITGATH